MANKIFINYRREDSIALAGRLRDRLAEIFGRDKIFMDVDNIPIGFDFVDDLEKQVAACAAMLSIVGPNWLDAKDKAGQRRLGNPGDYVTIEIKAALARNIPVIPVLVDGTPMPTAEQLPDSLKPFARRNAFPLRNANFGSDAEALVKKMREALGAGLPRSWRLAASLSVAAVAMLLLFGWIGLPWKSLLPNVKVKPMDEVDFIKRGDAYLEKGDASRAIADYTEAIRLKPNDFVAFDQRCNAYLEKGDYERAIADCSTSIGLNPKDPTTFYNRGVAYGEKGDYERAIADYTEAVRLGPNFPRAFCNRGRMKLKVRDSSGNADITKARQLDPSACP
jgi:tetratricopeptide (TPR) repeat protein